MLLHILQGTGWPLQQRTICPSGSSVRLRNLALDSGLPAVHTPDQVPTLQEVGSQWGRQSARQVPSSKLCPKDYSFVGWFIQLIHSLIQHSCVEILLYSYTHTRASLVAQLVKNSLAMWKTRVWSLGWEDPLEKGMATHSSILAWRIPWTV